MNAFGRMFINTHVKVFQLTGGKLGGKMGNAGTVLLLTTKGRKTGLQRTVPVVYIQDDAGHPVVTASMGGQPQNPAWFDNLSANSEVSYQTGSQVIRARAVVADPALREKLWAKLTAKHGQFLEYAKKTTRIIPMVVLEPLN
jgi:deazaflavin-dependent oxidoreductase (nitroreductase family)